MTNTHLVISCTHAHPDHDNSRADWLSKLIIDIRPDVFVHLGDGPDLPSLYQADKGKVYFKGQNYSKDIDSHCDFQARTWEPVAARKKKLPRRVYIHGNHDNRIQSAIDKHPELSGTISFEDLRLSDWYDDIVPYSGVTPGVIQIDGISYSHFSSAGISGRPVSGEHAGYTLLGRNYGSTTVGHSHLFDLCIRTRGDGRKIVGCTAGCYSDYTNDWAGELGKLWDRGVLVCRNVDNGAYDPEWISLESIKKEYST